VYLIVESSGAELKRVETKILYTSDLHGSETYFLKILSTAKNFNVDILFISGDLTGKAIVPIVKVDKNLYATTFFGRDYKIDETELAKIQKDIRQVGYYYYPCSREEYAALKAAPDAVDKLFDELMKSTLEGWIKKIEEVLPSNMRIIMNPGNDDHFSIDDILKRSNRIVYTIGKVENIDDKHALVSCEWVNPTPWNSPRECSEEELEKRIRKEFDKVSSKDNLVCDLHAPPYDCPLDLAPKLDKDLKPKTSFGQPVMEHVGSKAVRKVLKEYQPKLALHGHIHESAGFYKLGRTLCINPGSEYVEGIMHGYFLKLTPESVDYHPIMGG
jgi:Icc-related predicted phosphoesterase